MITMRGRTTLPRKMYIFLLKFAHLFGVGALSSCFGSCLGAGILVTDLQPGRRVPSRLSGGPGGLEVGGGLLLEDLGIPGR